MAARFSAALGEDVRHQAQIELGAFMSSAVLGSNAAATSKSIGAKSAPAGKVRTPVVLPNTEGFFEVRFESIGGLGAHAAGMVLATAAVVRMGLNGAHFSSYGSEKKGSLVRSFVFRIG